MDQSYVVEVGTEALSYHTGAGVLPNNTLVINDKRLWCYACIQQDEQEGRETLMLGM